ncbi:hypothetical protein EYF80_047045 [Liparis tanakae]|uniref:Uncharacterized protein n=1 Tax=Liparis tanakae TaxID=230148 RepID=A0A4Z2FNG8_9TELE|nr:hypothetical protein EYF80_047045 [Liparis tanakae]
MCCFQTIHLHVPDPTQPIGGDVTASKDEAGNEMSEGMKVKSTTYYPPQPPTHSTPSQLRPLILPP